MPFEMYSKSICTLYNIFKIIITCYFSIGSGDSCFSEREIIQDPFKITFKTNGLIGAKLIIKTIKIIGGYTRGIKTCRKDNRVVKI